MAPRLVGTVGHDGLTAEGSDVQIVSSLRWSHIHELKAEGGGAYGGKGDDTFSAAEIECANPI